MVLLLTGLTIGLVKLLGNAAGMGTGTLYAPVYRPQGSTGYQGNANSFYGTPIPVGFGKRAVVGVPLWKGDEVLSGTTEDDFKREVDFAVGFGKSGVPSGDLVRTDVIRLWMNGILVMDRTTEEGINASQDIDFTIHTGSETQLPDPLISAKEGVGQTPAFRGMVYIVFKKFPLHRFVIDRIPIVRAELVDIIDPLSLVHEFDRLAGAPDDTGGSAGTPHSATADWKLGRLFTFDRSATNPHILTYDIATNRMLASVPILDDFGDPLDDIIFGTGSNSHGPIYDPYYGRMLMFTDEGSSYSLHAVDPWTGRVLYSIANVLDTTDVPSVMTIVRATAPGDLAKLYVAVGGLINYWSIYSYDSQSFSLIHADARFDFVAGDRIQGMAPGEKLDEDDTARSVGDFASFSGKAVFYATTERYVYRIVLSLGEPIAVERIWTRPNNGDPANHGIRGFLVDKDRAEVIIFYDMDTGTDRFIANVRAGNAYLSEEGNGALVVDKEGSTTALFEDVAIPATPDFRGIYASADITFGTFGFQGALGSFHIVELRTGEVKTYGFDSYKFTNDLASGPFTMLVPNDDGLWYGTGGFFIGYDYSGDFDWSRIYVNRAETDRVPLASVLTWFCQYAGYDVADITVTGIDELVTGSLILQRVNLWALMGDTRTLFAFDIYESENKIKITRKVRGLSFAVDWTVPETELAWINSQGEQVSEDDKAFVTQRGVLEDPPGLIELLFIDDSLEYVVNMVSFKRTKFPVETVESDRVQQLAVPIIMTGSEALSYLARAMFDMWSQNVARAFRLGPKYMRMEPSDIVQTTVGSFTHVMKVIEGTLNADGSISLAATTFESEEIPVIEADGPVVPEQTVQGVSYADLFILDVPPFLYSVAEAFDADTLLFTNAIVSHGSNPWLGGELWSAWEGAGALIERYTNTTDGFHGIATTPIVDTGMPQTMDFEASLLVTVISGSIATITMDALLAGGNRLYYGATGRWEAIAPMTVTDNLDGTFTLTDIVRGLRGTEGAMGLHQTGDRIIAVAGGHIVHTQFPISSFGGNVRAAGVGVNEDVSDVAAQIWVANANSRKPLAPWELSATLDGSDIDFAWLRRSRAVTDFWTWNVPDDVDSIDGEEYEIDIYDTDEVTILRTIISLTSPAYTYLNADIITDFGAIPASIHIAVYQISANPGIRRGFPNKNTIDVAGV